MHFQGGAPNSTTNLGVEALVEEDVGGLHVAVHDVVAVQKGEGRRRVPAGPHPQRPWEQRLGQRQRRRFRSFYRFHDLHHLRCCTRILLCCGG